MYCDPIDLIPGGAVLFFLSFSFLSIREEGGVDPITFRTGEFKRGHIYLRLNDAATL